MGSMMSIEDTVKEHAHRRYNAHFMVVDGVSKMMSQRGGGYQSSDFHAYGFRCFKLSVGCPTGDPCLSKTFDLCINVHEAFPKQDSFISYEDLKKYLVNDKVVFCAEFNHVIPKFLNVNSFSRFTSGTAERIKLMDVPGSNSRFTWKITKFSTFNDEHHSSFEFTFGPRRWYLTMYPKGSLGAEGKYLSLFLQAADNVPEEATPVAYKLRVLDQLNRNHYEEIASSRLSLDDGGWGLRKFLPLEELHKASNGFLVNDEIYLGVEFLCFYTPENL
ncbi:unnamed protein product [Thlaspi arvense]|uniref:MATH domain-containing protein n=1 Tax=Thlaspi arvense TaxID=13288 RepID=A0AAU9SC29_THLAR|nr:unnamed protein product [Thlaspi arvense]